MKKQRKEKESVAGYKAKAREMLKSCDTQVRTAKTETGKAQETIKKLEVKV